jgi:hypothetical protein
MTKIRKEIQPKDAENSGAVVRVGIMNIGNVMRKCSMLMLFLITVVVIVTACGSSVPPKKRNFQNSAIIKKPYDEVWGKVIRYFGTNHIPVKSMEKVSGFIAAESEMYPMDTSYCDCGKMGFGNGVLLMENNKLSFNVIIEKQSENETAVTINANIQGYVAEIRNYDWHFMKWTLCYSTGMFEKILLDYLKQ